MPLLAGLSLALDPVAADRIEVQRLVSLRSILFGLLRFHFGLSLRDSDVRSLTCCSC